jgi:hypothetical protein
LLPHNDVIKPGEVRQRIFQAKRDDACKSHCRAKFSLV